MSRGVSARDLLIVLAVYLAAFLVVAGFPHPLAGFPLDDSWIHQVVARNLAKDGTLGFVPGVRSSGSSSLLWTFILAANWKLLPGLSPVLYSGIVSTVLLGATGWGLLAMARRDGLAESTCWIWALTPALDGNFLWLGMIGMEHLLFATLSIVGVYLWFQSDRRSAIGAALCLGALSLTRPEGVVLTVLALAGAGWTGRSRRDQGILGAVVAVCVGLSLLANYITSRSWLPTTYAGRKWLYFGSDQIPLMTRITFPYSLFRSLLQPWAVHQTHPLYVVNAALALLMGWGVCRLFSGRRVRTAFLTLWGGVHVLIYAAMLPTRSHGGRYQPLFLALSFPLLFVGLEGLLGRWPAPRRRGLMVAAACVMVGVPSLVAWREVTAAGIGLIEATHAKMGRLLTEVVPQGSKVAVLDIGRMGYEYGGNLGDLGGLTDRTFLPYMREHRIFAYLEERRVEYLVWPTSEEGVMDVPQILAFSPENLKHLTEVASFCAPYAVWQRSYEATLSAGPCQRLYRLRAER